MPCRIQRKRSKGWRMPAGAIYIGRPSKWGNPYWPGQSTDDFPMWLVGAYGKARLGPVVKDAQQAVDLYRIHIERKIRENPYHYAIKQLTGRDLACWCRPDQLCHGDVLLDIANEWVDKIITGHWREK